MLKKVLDVLISSCLLSSTFTHDWSAIWHLLSFYVLWYDQDVTSTWWNSFDTDFLNFNNFIFGNYFLKIDPVDEILALGKQVPIEETGEQLLVLKVRWLSLEKLLLRFQIIVPVELDLKFELKLLLVYFIHNFILLLF